MNELRQYMSYLAKPANKCLGPVAVIGPPDANVSLQRFLPLAGANWRGVESRLTESTSRTARSPADRTSAEAAIGTLRFNGKCMVECRRSLASVNAACTIAEFTLQDRNGCLPDGYSEELVIIAGL